MDSQRFPGKALCLFQGKPLIIWVLERAASSQQLEQVVLATTEREIDAPLVQIVKAAGFDIFRGASVNVADRILACARHFQASSFARINGDSPFLDVKLLDLGLSLQQKTGALLVSNLIPVRTYPYGVAVECLSTEKFAELSKEIVSKEDREHVTQFIYLKCPDKVVPLPPCPNPRPDLRLTIDTPEDLARLTDNEFLIKNNINLTSSYI